MTTQCPIRASAHARLRGGKSYCRIHHLIKTFYTGIGGWTDQQMPDGTIILTAPTGHTYATEAHGAALFPAAGAVHR